MAGIKDVARAAGVSPATVSRVLNGHRWVSPKTREAVLRAVKETKYRPSTVARSLRLRAPHSIGVLVNNPYGSAYEDVFFVRVALGIGKEAESRGYTMTLATLGSADEKPEMVQAKAVGGVVLAGTTFPAAEKPLFLDEDTPTVVIGKHYPKLKCPRVLIDNEGAFEQATRHLIRRGHERIAIVIGPRSFYAFEDRLSGYRKALEAARIPFSDELVVELPEFTLRTGFEAFRYLLTLPARPTAALVCDSAVSSGALQARSLFPNPLELITYGDHETLGIAAPLAVSSVCVSADEIGGAAARMLIDSISGRGESVNVTWITPKLVEKP